MQNKRRVAFDIFIARAGTALCIPRLLFWILIACVAFGEKASQKAIAEWSQYNFTYRIFPFIPVILAMIDLIILIKTRQTRRLIKDFRIYSNVLSGDKRISNLCEKLGLQPEKAINRLQEMCRRKYIDGYVNVQTMELVLNTVQGTDPMNAYVARCPGCGATTKIYNTGDVCRYCGNPLIAKE